MRSVVRARRQCGSFFHCSPLLISGAGTRLQLHEKRIQLALHAQTFASRGIQARARSSAELSGRPATKRDGVSIYVHEEASSISKLVARQISDLIRSKQAANSPCVLGLATGSTPVRVYKELIRMHQEEQLSFRGVVTFNLDEYWPMQPDAQQSYHRFMRDNLFDHVDVDATKTHVPNGTISLEDVPSYCEKYENAIREAGGIDLQLLGLGRTGHIGFNEPGSLGDSRTRLVHLDPITRKDAAKDFGGEDNVPTRAITMGVGSIQDAKRVILMAFGEPKAEIAVRSFEGSITEDVTASFLQMHANVGVYLDSAAAMKMSRSAVE